MAHIVRKVSNKEARGQRKRNKKLWFIIGGICLVAILCAVFIPLGIYWASSDDTVEVDDYFGQTQTYKVNDEEHEVNFTKATYGRLLVDVETKRVGHIFVFATDLSTFYPFTLEDSDGNDLKNSTHEAVFNMLVKLQYEIDQYNSKHEDLSTQTELLIIDTKSDDNSTNSSVLSNSTYAVSSDDDNTVEQMFCYYDVANQAVDQFFTPDKETKESAGQAVYSDSFDTMRSTVISNAILYMNNGTGFEEYKKSSK